MRRQKREHAARLQQMPGHRLDTEKIPLILRPSLHPKIIPKQKINKSRHTDYSGQS